MLSCDCQYDGYGVFYDKPIDFSVYARNRRKRCVSCGHMISTGEPCVEFECARETELGVEEDIYGEARPLAARFLCGQCGETYFNLDALGYCYPLGYDLRELLKDYWDLTGFEGVK